MADSICAIDGKLMKHPKSLSRHNKLHENGKYICDQCHKVFIMKVYLLQHVNQVHEDFVIACENVMKHFNI